MAGTHRDSSVHRPRFGTNAIPEQLFGFRWLSSPPTWSRAAEVLTPALSDCGQGDGLQA
jgi:hypothetical protein